MKKIRFIKSVISIVLMTSLFLVVLSRGNEAKAVSQTALETYYVCDDSTGWKYSTQKKHMASKTTSYYAVSESVRAIYNGYVTNGASMWGSYISMSYSTSGIGYIYAVNDSTTGATASTKTYAGNDGITTGWYICINSYFFDGNTTEGKNRTLAHEIGHVYGLGDLYESNYSSQIMYGYYSITKNVTSNDKNGMTVVTETHTHSSFYPQVYEQYSSAYHKVRCTTCKTYKLEEHSSTSYCSKCAYSSN